VELRRPHYWRDVEGLEDVQKLVRKVEKADLSELGGLLEEAKKIVVPDFDKLKKGDEKEREKFEKMVELSRAFARRVLEWIGREPFNDNRPPTKEDIKRWKEEEKRLKMERLRKDGYAARYLDVFGNLAYTLVSKRLYDEAFKLAVTLPWLCGEELVIDARLFLPREVVERLEEKGEMELGDPEAYLEGEEEKYVEELIWYATRKAVMKRMGDEVDLRGEGALEAVLRNRDVLSLWDRAIIAYKAKFGRRDLAEEIFPDLEEAVDIYYGTPY